MKTIKLFCLILVCNLSSIVMADKGKSIVSQSTFDDFTTTRVQISGDSAKKLYHTFADVYEANVSSCLARDGEVIFKSIAIKGWTCVNSKATGYFCGQTMYSDKENYFEGMVPVCPTPSFRVGG